MIRDTKSVPLTERCVKGSISRRLIAGRRRRALGSSIPPDSPENPDRRDATERELELLEQLTRWMDRRYLDPILGFLVPGAGDVLGSVMGVFGVIVAFRLRVHPIVIARMFLNLALDSLLGLLPLLGDVADIFYRAHSRNLALLEDRGPYEAQASDWLIVGGAALLFLVAAILPIVVGVALARWLWGLVG